MRDYTLYTRLDEREFNRIAKSFVRDGWRVAFCGMSGGLFWALLEKGR